MVNIISLNSLQPYTVGSIGDRLEKASAHAVVEEQNNDIVYHLTGERQSEEVLLQEKQGFKYYIAKDLLNQCGSGSEVVDFVERHPDLFIAPLSGLKHHQFSITEKKKLSEGAFGEVYHVTKIALDNINYAVDMILKLPKGVKGSDEDADIGSEMEFIHKLHQKLTPKESEKVFPDVHQITYEGKTGYLMGRYDDNLENCLKSGTLSQEEKIEIATQLVEQMAILAKYNALYTDIKLKNVLIKRSAPIKVALADFGDCFFLEDRKKMPDYGFTCSEFMLNCKDSGLFTNWMSIDDSALLNAAQQHQSSALGLMLCALFSDKEIPFQGIYDQKELAGYVKACGEFKGLSQSHPKLYNTILHMLHHNNGKQLMPNEAWEEWRNNAAEAKTVTDNQSLSAENFEFDEDSRHPASLIKVTTEELDLLTYLLGCIAVDYMPTQDSGSSTSSV